MAEGEADGHPRLSGRGIWKVATPGLLALFAATYGAREVAATISPDTPAIISAAPAELIPTPLTLLAQESNTVAVEAQVHIPFQLPHHADSSENPVKLPAWVDPVLSSLDINCEGFEECQQRASELPIVGEELGGYHHDESYVPEGLVPVGDYKFIYTLGSNNLLKEQAIEPLRGFVTGLRAMGYDVVLRSGYRSYDSQADIHDHEASASAPPGYSQHQSGFAFDIHRRTPDGQIGEPISFSREIAALANKYGIVHPFDWDRPHYLVLDAIFPGLTQAMIDAGVDPNNSENILYVLLGIEQIYEVQANQ